MKKQEKVDLVGELTDRFKRAKVALLSEYKGMTAAESTELRRRLRAVNGELKVAKNTLVKLAVQDTDYAGLEAQLVGPVGLVLGFEDPVALAKALTTYKEAGDKLKVRAGVLDGKPLTKEEIEALASMPPKEVVLGQLLGLLQAPASQLVRLFNEPGSMLARAIDAIGKKNGGGEAPSENAAAEAAPESATEMPAAESGKPAE